MLSEQFNKPVDGSANYESPSGTQDKIIFSLSFIYFFFFAVLVTLYENVLTS